MYKKKEKKPRDIRESRRERERNRGGAKKGEKEKTRETGQKG